MPDTFHFDYETRSRCDLTKLGAFRYANDPTTEIVCIAVKKNKEPARLWVNPKWNGVGGAFTHPGAMDWLEAMSNPGNIVYAHNAQFEIAISDALFEKTVKLVKPRHEQFRCTAAMARRAGIPASLEKAGETLKVATQKDKRGKALIKTFSIPQPMTAKTHKGQFIEPYERPQDFKAFCDYCLTDTESESQVHTALAPFELAGAQLDSFQLDIAINTRGLAVNVDALRKAQAMVEEVTPKLTAAFREVTGLDPNQNKELLKWLRSHGYKRANLTAETLDEVIEHENFDPNTPVGKALLLKQKIGYASIKKIPAMLAMVGPHDNRLRGMLKWYGAQATGRWASELVQLQNLKRPTIKNSGSAYRAICNGVDASMVEWFYGEPLEVISSIVRHFVQDGTNQMFDADYSAVEARIVNWLSGQHDAVKEFAAGIDRYKKMASVIYGKPVDQINDFPERFVGKQATLGCGFQMGPPKFRGTCAKYGYELPPGLEDTAVGAFRDTHLEVAKMWRVIEHAAKCALKNPGQTFRAGEHLLLFSRPVAGINYLFMKLPSGRNLAYAHARVCPMITYMEIVKGKPKKIKIFNPTDEQIAEANQKDEKAWFHEESINYYSQLPQSKRWDYVDTYGGKLLENATQAVAADLMSHGAVLAERAGYEIAVLIHDQALAYKKPGQTIEELVKHLTTLPGWAAGLPLASEGKVVAFYSK